MSKSVQWTKIKIECNGLEDQKLFIDDKLFYTDQNFSITTDRRRDYKIHPEIVDITIQDKKNNNIIEGFGIVKNKREFDVSIVRKFKPIIITIPEERLLTLEELMGRILITDDIKPIPIENTIKPEDPKGFYTEK